MLAVGEVVTIVCIEKKSKVLLVWFNNTNWREQKKNTNKAKTAEVTFTGKS